MSDRRSPLYWSVPAGTWYYTQVRISVFFLLLVVVLCHRLDSVQLGLAFGLILFISVVLHEFGHVVAARLTGGSGDEILIWPLGGLASVRPAATLSSEVTTALAGPLVNLILCLVTLPALLLDSPYVAEAFHPFLLPPVELSDHLISDVFVLLFSANWMLLLTNLIPVFPLDGGQALKAILKHRFRLDIGIEVYLRVGCAIAFLAVLGGLFLDNTWVLAIGALVLILNLQEASQLRGGQGADESFMGYDFSRGYTSLEQSASSGAASNPGVFQKWREQRRADKIKKRQERELQLETQIDSLLEKVHADGLDSLTEHEKRLLTRASAIYRKKEGRRDA